MGGQTQEAPDTVGAANAEIAADRIAFERELEANRPNYNGPQSSTTWEKERFYDPSVDAAKGWRDETHATLDPETGKWMINPYDINDTRRQYYRDLGYAMPTDAMHDQWKRTGESALQPFEAPANNTRWEMETKLNDEWQAYVDMGMDMASAEAAAKTSIANQWAIPIASVEEMFGTQTGTTGADDWKEYGSPSQTIGADGWREFGSTAPTTSATGYEKFGKTTPTLGADDWREFGTASPTINSGTYDERFGNAGDHGYGDHDMGGGDWDYVNYSPEYIRQQAQDSMYAYDTARLDPQFEQDRAALEIKLSNQGLAMGDQAYDAAMTSFNNNKNRAYEDARNQSMEASRAEAAMLWDQEMGRSEQKNKYTQQDWDNAYQARQGNIQNYLGGRQQDMQGYLDYSNAAYGQEFNNIQQQLDANRMYSNDAYQQDLASREQQLKYDLGYSGQAFDQDFQSRQADIANNLRYGESAFNQDLAARRYQTDNDLRFADQQFDQENTILRNKMEAEMMREQLMQGRYNSLDPVGTASGISDAISGGQ